MTGWSAAAFRHAGAHSGTPCSTWSGSKRNAPRLGREDVKVGGQFRVETPNVLDWLDALSEVAAMIDAEFVDRFGMRTVELYQKRIVH